MNNVTETLKECHRIVWRYRAELQQVWPTPTRTHALIFALSELGEVADAMMRTHPKYARNNERETNVLDEWADVALMVLTALGKPLTRSLGDTCFDVGDKDALASVAQFLGIAMVRHGEGEPPWRYDLIDVLNIIVRLEGMDLPQRLAARLERIKAKQMPVLDDTYANALLRHAGECQ